MPLNEGATNEIKPFAPDGQEAAGDLLSLAEYEADTQRLRGNQPGIARRSLVNRALRQVAHVAAGLGQFIANRHAPGVVDDGDLDKIETGLVAATEAVAAPLVAAEAAAREAHEADTDNPHGVTLEQLGFQGFAPDGQHEIYDLDLDAIARNSLYAVQQGVATHLPGDMAAGVWGYVQTMVLPGDIGRTQVLWSQGDPDRPGWWRRRAAGTWGDWRLIGSGSGMPVGTVLWVPGTTPPAGMLAINDGASVSRASVPQLWEYAQGSGLLITEAEWQAQAAAQSSVGYFSSGDGATTLRLPRLRDYLRGADPTGGRAVGAWQGDEFKAHTHGLPQNVGVTSGAGSAMQYPGSLQSQSGSTGGSETRPKSINWLPCIQAASVPVNAATVDMLALASEVANKADRAEVGVVQVAQATSTAVYSVSAVTPQDDTPPQITEGAEIMSLPFTPSRAGATILVRLYIPCVRCVGQKLTCAIHQSGAADAIGAGTWGGSSTQDGSSSLVAEGEFVSDGVSPITISARAGVTSGTGYINSSNGPHWYGSAGKMILTAEELS